MLVTGFAFARYCVINPLLDLTRFLVSSVDYRGWLSKYVEPEWAEQRARRRSEPDAFVSEFALEREALEEKNAVAMQLVQREREQLVLAYHVKDECFWVGAVLWAGYLSPHHFIHQLATSGTRADGSNPTATLLGGLAYLIIGCLWLKAIPYLSYRAGIYLPGNTVNRRDRARQEEARRASSKEREAT